MQLAEIITNDTPPTGDTRRGRGKSPRAAWSRLRRAFIVPVAVVVLAAAPTPASAESALWTMTASPLVATTGVGTTFAIRATNDDPLAALLSNNEIGCVRVDVPSNFTVATASVTGSSAGGSWTANVTGNRVTVRALAGGDRLATLDWVRFTVTATAMSPNSLGWASRAFRQQDCSGSGAPLGIPPIVIVSGPAATPAPISTPQPTPVPTPSPTLAPTPRPTATPILPLPTTSLPPILPTGVTPAPSVSPRPSGSATPTPRPSLGTGGPASTPGPGSPGSTPGTGDPSQAPGIGGGGPTFGEGAFVEAGTLALAPVTRVDGSPFGGDFASIEMFGDSTLWLVPAATIAAPGLLLLIWAAVQAGGALLWAPAIRRLRRGGVHLRTA